MNGITGTQVEVLWAYVASQCRAEGQTGRLACRTGAAESAIEHQSAARALREVLAVIEAIAGAPPPDLIPAGLVRLNEAAAAKIKLGR